MLFIKTNQQAYTNNQVLYYFEAKPFDGNLMILRSLSQILSKENSNYIRLIDNSFVSFENADKKTKLIAVEVKRDKSVSKLLIPESGVKFQFCFTSWEFHGRKIERTGLKITVTNYKNYLLHNNPIVREYKIFISRDILKAWFSGDPFTKKKVLESPSKMKDFIFENLD